MPQNVVVLVGRILLSAMFILAGYPKLLDPSGTAGMIAGAGLPAATALAYLTGLFELVAGLFILVGFQTKIAAYLLALFCVFTALVFHSGPINVPDFPEGANGLLTMFNGLMMMKNLTIAGGFLVLAAFGPGSISVDARRGAAPLVA
ncbi:DoxX family protein [Rhizobium sp. TRM96647]|uniref:DoxX family protein n=1 Tax=unclassified Rhizobium TaxID=2613769 RepID=UPI001E5BA651|nr:MULTISPECIES: DoxX family protein [unclassified Rhizobium]MCD2183601.1 DoxX family protein [Rhizobium sp. GN54]MCV3736619.1 DoxX family protein [Rhizobium sp. TRM96647]MCV3758988.1 DoxX family protein [Rhizobium sp. TRM96650]